MEIEAIAAICHEANRRYCHAIGDDSERSWETAPWRQKQSAIAGVVFVTINPEAPPSKAHENWLEQKIEEGWKYGSEKDEDNKIHPCILPYEKLPEDQKMKDRLFRSIVLALIEGETHA